MRDNNYVAFEALQVLAHDLPCSLPRLGCGCHAYYKYVALRRGSCLPLTRSAACLGWAVAAMRDAQNTCEQAGDGGNLTVTFQGPPGANASACSGAVQWPRLDALLLLGVGPIDVASLHVQVP